MSSRRLPATLTALALGLSGAVGLSACSDRQDRDQGNDGGARPPFTQPSPTPQGTQTGPSGAGVQTSTASAGTDPTP